MTLYEITEDFKRLLEIAEDDDDELALHFTLEALNAELEDKCDGIAVVIQALKDDISSIDEEIKRLTKRKTVCYKNLVRIKDYLINCMKAMGKKKIKTALRTFTISKNGGKQPVVMNDGVIVDDLPSELVRVTLSPDMEMIREMVEKGDTKYAHFEERGEHLTIR